MLRPAHPGYDGSDAPGLDAQRARRRGRLPGAASRSTRRRAAGATSPWSASASAAGSPPRWRPWRRARSAGSCWSARWGSSRERGEIADQALVSYIDYVRLGFADQGAYDRVFGAETPTRPARAVGPEPRDDLPHRVEAVHVQRRRCRTCSAACATPTLVVWGARTASCRSSAASATPRRCRRRGSRSIEGAGHFVEMEKPEALAKLVRRSCPPAEREGPERRGESRCT